MLYVCFLSSCTAVLPAMYSDEANDFFFASGGAVSSVASSSLLWVMVGGVSSS